MVATVFDKILFCGREATKGTSPFSVAKTFVQTVTDAATALTASATNPDIQAVKARTVTIQPNVTAIERPLVKGTMGPANNVIGRKSVTLNLELELKGAGALGVAPEYTPILEACGVTTTMVASTSVTLAPAITTLTLNNGVSIRLFVDGLLWEITGCAGTCTVDMTAGNILVATIVLQGMYTAPVVAAIGDLSTVVYDVSSPVVVDTLDVVNDGGVINVAAMNFDMGNNVTENYTTGSHVFDVSNRNPVLTYTKDSVSTITEWVALVAGTNTTVSATFSQGGAGNIVTFNAPSGTRSNTQYNERDARVIHDVSMGLFESGVLGNDQWNIVLT